MPDRIRELFMYRHWKSQVLILQEGTPPLPLCSNCGMHMNVAKMIRNQRMDRCNR